MPDDALVRPGGSLSNALPGLAPNELRRVVMEFTTAAEAHAKADVQPTESATFDVALERSGCPPQQCVMVGDSEVNDIKPAADLGMRTIRVTVQHGVQGKSRADAVATSLDEVAAILRTWSPEAPRVPAS